MNSTVVAWSWECNEVGAEVRGNIVKSEVDPFVLSTTTALQASNLHCDCEMSESI